MANKFNVGDMIKPNQSQTYVYTRSPHMIEGVVVEVDKHKSNNIRIEITKANGNHRDRVGKRYPVHANYFDLATPMNAEQGFNALLAGTISDEEYEQIIRRECE